MKKDLTGRTFGRLLVLGVSEVSRNGHYRYSVSCECGTLKTVLGTHLLANKTNSCGCLRTQLSRNWKGYKGVPLTYFSSLVRGANGGKGRKPIDFNITLEFIGDLLEKQENRCALSGLPISYKTKTISLDRIDSSKGYETDNVQWVHKDINMMKRHYSTEYFKYLCKMVTGEVCEIVDLT